MGDDTRLIALGNNKYAIVDAINYIWLSKFKWICNAQGYAVHIKYIKGTRNKNGVAQKNSIIRMHRLIMNTPNGMKTDHINGNKLDNRISNLRICNGSENNCNQRKTRGSSKYKGVSWNKRKNKWQAYINKNGIRYHLGYFNSEEKAAIIYNKAALIYHADFSCLNKVA